MLRGVGLDQHPAGERSPPRAPGHLGEQLEGPLRREVVRQVERDVGGDHRGEGDVGRSSPLAASCGPDQDVDPAVAEVVVDRLEAATDG